jgi:hypothetical protein
MNKKYSVNTKDDEIDSIEVDGVLYHSLEEIPDPEDRAQVERLMAGSTDMEEPPFDFPQTKPFPVARIVFAVFAGVAALMLVITVIAAFGASTALAREDKAPGRVVELVTRRDEDGNEFYYPVVEFSPASGQRRNVQIAEGSWPAAYAVGDEVTVAYDREQPRNARIDSFGSTLGLWIVPIITGVLGVAFSVAAWFARWMMKTE